MPSEAKELEREEREQEAELETLLADAMREAWPRNAAIWIGVVAGSLVVILVVLVVVSGG